MCTAVDIQCFLVKFINEMLKRIGIIINSFPLKITFYMWLWKLQGEITSRTNAEGNCDPDPARIGVHAQARILPQRPEAGERAVQRDRDGQAGRLRPGEGNPLQTSLHRLRLDAMVSTYSQTS